MTRVSESFKKGIVQRIFRNFLDVMILRLVRTEPMWGYRVLRYVEEQYGIRIRHGALYPLLNSLERKGFLRSRREAKGGRVRRVYEITSKGMQFLDAYNEVLQEQTKKQGIKAAE